ncbi:MAG: Uncharacterized protein FD138_1116 [Planctomycetota bacterium]|nr:MAG: Uncharacterized protein FD138_1116 [Planctomycetota bacterium]
MTDRILQRYTRTDRDDSDPTANDLGEVDDLGSFGWLRGIRDRAIMLEFRKRDGNSVAFDYGWLRKVEFNPSDGIKLYFGGDTVVKITGRNLNQPIRPHMQLLRGILTHRVLWIQEASEPDLLQAADNATVIEAIACS